MMNKRWIFLDLPGGLGNQLFAYYFAASLNSSGKDSYFFNTRYIDLSHSHGQSTIKNYAFNIPIHFYDLGFLLNRLFEPFKKYLKNLNRIPALRIAVLDDTNLSLANQDINHFIERFNPKIIIIFGFWQNLQYISRTNRPYLNQSSDYFRTLTNRMSIEEPVIFHYRLGRKNGQWEHAWGALDAGYLQRSIQCLKDSDGEFAKRPVWVFSNDLTEAKTILAATQIKLEFIEDSKLSPSELFELLANSKSLICSNSTFSILAAKVGDIKQVVIPRELSRNVSADIRGIPHHWNRVESSWLE